jgi:hypothetical protein
MSVIALVVFGLLNLAGWGFEKNLYNGFSQGYNGLKINMWMAT